MSDYMECFKNNDSWFLVITPGKISEIHDDKSLNDNYDTYEKKYKITIKKKED